jgi:hypothetical protein
MIDCVTAHPDLQDLAIFILATTDAHELYRRYGGFELLEKPEKWMSRRKTSQSESLPGTSATNDDDAAQADG